MRQKALIAALAIPSLFLAVYPASAITISFVATDEGIPGPNGGQVWRYTYQVSSFAPLQNLAFEVLFDPSLYSDLESPPPNVNGWDTISLQPDLGIPDPGRYSALAIQDGASLVGPFTITFAWLGGAGIAPGAQPFELNEFDGLGNFVQTLEIGQTVPAGSAVVAEPATVLTTGLLLLGLIAGRRITRMRGTLLLQFRDQLNERNEAGSL